MTPPIGPSLLIQVFTGEYGAATGRAKKAVQLIHDIASGVRSDVSPAIRQIAALVGELKVQSVQPTAKKAPAVERDDRARVARPPIPAPEGAGNAEGTGDVPAPRASASSQGTTRVAQGGAGDAPA